MDDPQVRKDQHRSSDLVDGPTDKQLFERTHRSLASDEAKNGLLRFEQAGQYVAQLVDGLLRAPPAPLALFAFSV